MEIYQDSAKEKRDFASLLQLLKTAQESLAAPDDFRLVSIQLRVSFLDPLAVLTEIHNPEEWHFFCENSTQRTSLAAAGKLWHAQGEGAERFRHLENAYEKIWERTVLAGDIDVTQPELKALHSFSFHDQIEGKKDFPEAEIVIPKWMVEKRNRHFYATANTIVTREQNLEKMAAYILEAHGKFTKFEYGSSLSASTKNEILENKLLPEKSHALQMIAEAIQEIKENRFYKIVLSRRKEMRAKENWNALKVANTLRKLYPECYTFSLGNEKGVRWVGATPEQLFSLRKNEFETVALAGTTERHDDALQDASLGAALLQSPKNLSEQNIVHQYLHEKLEELGLHPQGEEPVLLQLRNVQHIFSLLRCPVLTPLSPWKILETLHPTPALGGYPRGEVRAKIKTLETYERGLYGGGFAIFSSPHSGQAMVAIRCARLEKNIATLYAGAGIMSDSQPEDEFLEMENKFHAVENALRQN